MRWKVDHAIERVGRVPDLGVELTSAESDELVRLWVEHVCWQVQLVDWSMRRPPWWRWRELREWRQRREELDAAGDRLRARARAAQDGARHSASTDDD